jgi:hypothetical protein
MIERMRAWPIGTGKLSNKSGRLQTIERFELSFLDLGLWRLLLKDLPKLLPRFCISNYAGI